MIYSNRAPRKNSISGDDIETTIHRSASHVCRSRRRWPQQTSPVGLWKNIDDESGKPKALIRITESNGELQGKIEKLFRNPGEDQIPNAKNAMARRRISRYSA